jgi:hypothetical protein
MPTVKERHAPHVPHIPYLTLPLKNGFSISEGYIYSKYETSVHGRYFHYGIDYACPYGTPVYASASGYAVAGYNRFTELNEDGTFKLYKGLPMGNGLGYFIQIYHPYNICKVKGGRITQYGHLSKFAKGFRIKTLRPLIIDFEEKIRRRNAKRKVYRKSEKELEKAILETKDIVKQYPWTKKKYGLNFKKHPEKKEIYMYTLRDIKKLYKKGSRYVKWVEQGDLIGYAGTSGIVWGDLQFRENCRRPNVKEFNIWDECHLHFEEATRNIKTGMKQEQRDPYGVYLSKEHYRNIKQETLFKEERQRRLW